MRVYGDRTQTLSPALTLEEQAAARTRIGEMPGGLERHAALVGLFIDAAKLVQGLADHDLQIAGGDGASPLAGHLMGDLVELARAVMQSWDSDFQSLNLPAPPIVGERLPPTVEVRRPEGYAYYGLYPEAYALAARSLPPRAGPSRVIGIRSIGTGLAAMAAVELGAPPPLTVRPQGHPFSRGVTLVDGSLQRFLTPDARYLVVDEGPGLSGSSFAAVAKMLMSQGVGAEQIVLMPGHGGPPGPKASEEIRRLWAEVTVWPASSDGLASQDRICHWASTLLGPLVGTRKDLGGGAWRSARGLTNQSWDPRTDRRKLLVRNADGAWLVKFAGLGADGARKARRGMVLARAGLIPEVRGIMHGFLVQRWIEAPRDASPSLHEVALYLAERALRLPPPHQLGATLADLAEMAIFNTRVELGADAAERLRRRLQMANDLQTISRPMAIDGKLDRCEWLRAPGGRLLKADALDHDAEHDLVGPQDLAWDIAGAAMELGLSSAGLAHEAKRRTGRAVNPDLLAFLTPCYLAFRLGAVRMAQGMQTDVEAQFSAGAAERYAGQLTGWLNSTRPA
jgi:hypothetical protein